MGNPGGGRSEVRCVSVEAAGLGARKRAEESVPRADDEVGNACGQRGLELSSY